MRNKYLCKSEFAWNIHIQVMLKMTSFSIFNMYELVRTCMAARGIDFKIPRLTGILWIGSQLDQRTVHQLTDRQMHTFPDQMNWQFVQILMYSKFHSKLRVLDTDDVKQDFVVFCSGKICLVLFQGCCSFVLRHLCPVPIYYMNWSWMQSTEWIDLIGNPISACRLISGNNISLAWWNMFNFGEYAEIRRPPSTSLKESNFPGLILKFPDSTNCPLRGKQLIFLAL